MTTGSPQGRRTVATGRIKVDARRAVAKLREHLLVDLHLYAHELVRAASASGATSIELRHDADDVVLTWDGAPFDAEALPRLLDHVVGEGHTAEGRRLRLLALGVNAALGLDPLRVDLITTDERGDATRVRWTPRMIDPDEATRDDDAPRAERAPPSEPMAPRRTRVHFRRRVGLDVLRRAALREVPREIELLADATHELRAALTVAAAPLERSPRARGLVRVPLELRGVSRAWLELLPAGSAPSVEWLEHGVCLLRSPGSAAVLAMPVRVVIDAEELPTNASRSALREDAPLLGLVATASEGALRDAIAALARAVTGEAAKPADAVCVELLLATPDELEDALGAIACAVAIARSRGASLTPELLGLLELPLFRDGAGRPRTTSSVLASARAGGRVFVWRGKKALGPELGPWMGGVVWARGRGIEQLLGALPCADAAPVVALAKLGLERRQRLLAHAPSEAVLPPSDAYVARERFRIEEGELAGLEGEVALTAPREGAGSTVRAFVERRAIAALAISRATLPLPLEIAIGWEGRLSARFDYGGVEEDTSLRVAIWRASRVGVALASLLAAHLHAMTELERGGARSLLRAAVGTLIVTRAMLGLEALGPERVSESFPALGSAKIWPTTESSRFTSLDELWSYASRARALCMAPPGAAGAAADGRPVVCAEPAEADWIMAALGGICERVPYAAALLHEGAVERESRCAAGLESALLTELGDPEQAVKSGFVATLFFRRPGCGGVIAVAALPGLIEHHAGVRLSRLPLQPSFGAVLIAVDDDAIVPSPGWNGVRWRPDEAPLRDVERELCANVVAALEGDPGARARLGPLMVSSTAGVEGALLVYLIDSATALRARLRERDDAGSRALLERIEALPILDVLDERGAVVRASLSSLPGGHGSLEPGRKQIPVLSSVPGFETFDWRPVVLWRIVDFDALSRWAPGSAWPADIELLSRAARAKRETLRRALLAQPELAPGLSPRSADLSLPTIRLDATASAPGIELGLLRAGGAELGRIDVTLERRAVTTQKLELPVVARVELADASDLAGQRAIRPGLEVVLRERVVEAAFAWLAEHVWKQPKVTLSTLRILEPRVLDLARILLAGAGGEARLPARDALKAALRSGVLWPTAQAGSSKLEGIRSTDGETHVASERYASWKGPTRTRSELDHPALWVPRSETGQALLRLLRVLGVEKTRDVTDGLAKLQAQRAGHDKPAAPRLAGEAAHPALRVVFDALGSQATEGELELVAQDRSDIQIVDIDGVVRRVDANLAIPMRLVARVESVGVSKEVAVRLAKESVVRARRILRELVPKLEELPTFVRKHLRALACADVEANGSGWGACTAWRVFPDTAGAWHSLDEAARSSGPWPFTSGPPPWPVPVRTEPVLVLTADEAKSIGKNVPLEDATSRLREERLGQERAAAAPLAGIGLDPEQRRQCLWVAEVDDEGVRGEVGVLAPRSAEARGILVHATKRPLCLVEDAPGWPLLAAIDDARAKPNTAFDGLADTGAAERIRVRVRARGDARLREAIAPPSSAVASRFVSETLATEDGPLVVVGALWLPAIWPVAPVVWLHAPGGDVRAPLVTFVKPSALVDGTLAVEGELCVAPATGGASFSGAQRAALARLALEQLVDMLPSAEAAGASPAVLAAYRMGLALLGWGDASAPVEGGGKVSASVILDELTKRRALWTSEQRGSAEGHFPGDPPAFVLAGPSAEIDVLRARVVAGALRELGGVDAPESPASASPRVKTELGSLLAGDPAPDEGWLARVRGGLRSLLADEAKDEGPPSAPSLRAALAGALARLELTGSPVSAVKYAKKGRLLRFDKASGILFLNQEHPALRERRPLQGRALAMLVAAALSEVNHALTAVTDAEEARALRVLIGA